AAPTGGEARLENVPAATVLVKADVEVAGWIDGPTVTLRPGQTERVELRLEGPDLARRIVVHVRTRPYAAFEFPPQFRIESLTLSGRDQEKRVAKVFKDGWLPLGFDDVPPGKYTLAVDDPRFLACGRHDA